MVRKILSSLVKNVYVYMYNACLSWCLPVSLCVEVYHSVILQSPQVFYREAVLQNFAIFTGKYLCWSLLLIKLQFSRPATLLKRNSNSVFLQHHFLKKKTFFEEQLQMAAFEKSAQV